MLASPIAYSVDMIPRGLLPIMGLNPLFYLIISYQDILMMGQWPRNNVFIIFAILSIITFYVGHWFFSKVKVVFVDYL